ncbi:MAG: DUF664 domain-containing protein [Nocardioidaceae bacterium]|nr:DUF664 domain-containing protein [Nocardioidaceae bacterium]NUS52153.1 DUF664 domain-containing protein [Nocardioidaceae bacterium]
MTEFPEPRGGESDPGRLFARYLDFYRETVVRKAESLSDDDLRRSRLPSGWTPVELVSHLAHMERRWFVWGFLGEDVDDPWGEARDDRWHVPDDVPLDVPVAMLREVGRRTTDLLATHALDEPAPPGPRFDDEPPTLSWICFHVLQEYARHAGHLDIAVELAGGAVGE